MAQNLFMVSFRVQLASVGTAVFWLSGVICRVYLGRGGGSAQVPGLPDTCPSFSQLVSVSPHCTRDTHGAVVTVIVRDEK